MNEEELAVQETIELTFVSRLGELENEEDNREALNLSDIRYKLLLELGQDRMGEILAAQDQNLRRTVAYKKIHPQMIEEPEVISRFVREAQITAQLEHPNIMPVYDLSVQEDGSVAYSMKLIEGESLKDLLDRAREQAQQGLKAEAEYSLDTLLEYLIKVCDAMNYAHNEGFIHRDLKPANIRIGAYNEVYIMDWCAAKQIKSRDRKMSKAATDLLRLPPEIEASMDTTRLGNVWAPHSICPLSRPVRALSHWMPKAINTVWA